MPPKGGLLGTLSAIALGAGLAVAGPASAQDQNQLEFVRICSWIDDANDEAEVRRIIALLDGTNEECPFDEVSGRTYCTVCLTLAAQKLETMIATAAPPPFVPAH